ncbi:hypothetical protein BV25DRAFT_1823473 [Artomyces pyxidatus]|uniref:Uncharacterized protein n=1 Tax=Artomyces pyxidatus TaxID=48021 RepID=A0ACB8T785_9AGAM|nr:hypothetical protein BV25DRAFT_1823473 [Artomyces pyxidatus]
MFASHSALTDLYRIHAASKDAPQAAVYLRQPCTLQIIQLVECPPPPRQHAASPSVISSSSYSSSDASSAYESSSEPPTGDDDDDDCVAGASYCSSLPEEPPSSLQHTADRTIDDTYRVRMRRVGVWRDAINGLPPSPTPSGPAQKRKAADAEPSVPDQPRKLPRPAPTALSCPACDADFASPSGLRQHARASASANDACRVAVEYGLE